MSDDPSSWPVPLDDGRPPAQQLRDLLDERELREVKRMLIAHIGDKHEHHELTPKQYAALIVLLDLYETGKALKRIAAWVLIPLAAVAGALQSWTVIADKLPWSK